MSLLDNTPLEDVLQIISDFREENPDRFIYIVTEDQHLPNYEAIKQAADLFTEFLPKKQFENITEYEEYYENNEACTGYVGNCYIPNENPTILASQEQSGRLEIAQESEVKSTIRYQEGSLNFPNFFVNGGFYNYGADGINAGSDLDNSDKYCDYFQNVHQNTSYLATTFDSSLFYSYKQDRYSEENIKELFDCGVRMFKFDYIQTEENLIQKGEFDARPLSVDKHTLEYIQQNYDLTPTQHETCQSLIEQNEQLSRNAIYPFPATCALLAPIYGKAFKDLESMFGEGERYSGDVKKYDNFDPLYSVGYGVLLGAARQSVDALENSYSNIARRAAFPLKVALTVSDLYLHSQSDLFSPRLSNILNPRREMMVLEKMVNWDELEQEFSGCYLSNYSKGGCPPKPIRLMVGLLLLQHMHSLSDELVVERWVENPYWQYFCGYDLLQWKMPIDPSSLTRFRNRIGEVRMEKILSLTVKIAIQSKFVEKKDLKKL